MAGGLLDLTGAGAAGLPRPHLPALPVERLSRVGLVKDLAVVRAQLDLATRAQPKERLGAFARFRPIFQDDVALGIDLEPLDSRPALVLQVEPDDSLVHVRLDDAMLDEHLALEEDDALVVLSPGRH